MGKTLCPLCDTKVANFETLNMHIAGKHVHYNRDMRTYVCWCGFDYHSFAALWHHWEALGGVVAHYLACQLGEPVHGETR